MSEGAPMMYHGSGGFGGPGQMYMVGGQVERAPRQYPLEVLQIMGGVSARGSPGGTPRRWPPRRDRPSSIKPAPASSPSPAQDTAFGYDSDDSSLSSNASGSNKSGEKGEGSTSTSTGSSSSRPRTVREWRGRRAGGGGGGAPRDPPQRPQRRIAPDRYLTASYPFQVKFTPDDLLNGSKYDTLSQEMWDKFIKSQQTEETFRKKMNLWRYLYISIKSQVPRYGLYVVGSTMSGFGLDSSDMDLCLYVRPVDNLEPRAFALVHLNFILGFIKDFDPGAELIQAKVPILKFRDARAALQVDLNCNNVVGIRNTNLLHYFSRLDWRVRPLVVVTKLWAQAHDINDARNRTLSSYSLTLMVIHFLQCGTSPGILPRGVDAGGAAPPPPQGRHNRLTLAELFIHMLKYYADFPWSRMAVSVRWGARVPVAECRAVRAHKNDPHQWKLLCVEEPFDLTNTARSVYDPDTFDKIVATFRDSYRRVARGLRLADAWPA